MAQNKKRRRRRRMRKRTRNRLILAGGILVVLFILYLLIHFIVGLFSSPEPKDNTGTTPETKTSEETVSYITVIYPVKDINRKVDISAKFQEKTRNCVELEVKINGKKKTLKCQLQE